MCLLLETIQLNDGELHLLPYHHCRMNKARKELFGLPDFPDLRSFIVVPESCRQGVYRCRITYDQAVRSVEFIPHINREVRKMRIVQAPETLNYCHKYADRSALQQLFDQRADCDEIVIVRNGLVTDCFTGNLIFFDGLHWWTPSVPLLNATKRQYLIDQKRIREREIRLDDLPRFSHIGIINVFYDFENPLIISVNQLIF